MAESFACRLDALDAGARSRHATLLRELTASVAGVTELPDGYLVSFPARPFLFLRLAEWIEIERACCPFLKISVELGRGSGEFRVSVTGPPGAKELLASEMPAFAPTA